MTKELPEGKETCRNMNAISAFQFMTPYLIKAEFKVHPDRNEETTNQVNININKNERIFWEENRALLEVTVQLNKNEQIIIPNTLFDAEVTMISQFKWEEGLSKEFIENLLHYNGVALLLSYIRPILSSLSSASPYTTYDLPYINLNEMYKKEKNIPNDGK